jgi:hypothetical protein
MAGGGRQGSLYPSDFAAGRRSQRELLRQRQQRQAAAAAEAAALAAALADGSRAAPVHPIFGAMRLPAAGGAGGGGGGGGAFGVTAQ